MTDHIITIHLKTADPISGSGPLDVLEEGADAWASGYDGVIRICIDHPDDGGKVILAFRTSEVAGIEIRPDLELPW